MNPRNRIGYWFSLFCICGERRIILVIFLPSIHIPCRILLCRFLSDVGITRTFHMIPPPHPHLWQSAWIWGPPDWLAGLSPTALLLRIPLTFSHWFMVEYWLESKASPPPLLIFSWIEDYRPIFFLKINFEFRLFLPFRICWSFLYSTSKTILTSENLGFLLGMNST